MFASLPPTVTPFQDDDSGFFAWLQSNPDGYFINSERNPKPNYLVLHRASCPHFKSPNKRTRRQCLAFAGAPIRG